MDASVSERAEDVRAQLSVDGAAGAGELLAAKNSDAEQLVHLTWDGRLLLAVC